LLDAAAGLRYEIRGQIFPVVETGVRHSSLSLSVVIGHLEILNFSISQQLQDAMTPNCR